ncbi:YbcC family protein [Sandarakinorhabdus sp. DWP1-3-1]|uniref:YbcC family protein n=1 Tax=Sandarakinorhabdus sp. DWP1-3-1 TaxID=2804627 RepID=UPI003CF0BE2D
MTNAGGAVLVHEAAAAAALAIPPVWPLAASVAVNPWLGQAEDDLATVSARMARVAGVAVTMDRRWYADRLAAGMITEADLQSALATAPPALRLDPALLRSAMHEPAPAPVALPTVADLAAAASGIDWPAIIAERFGNWAAAWFDEGQALWAAPRGKSAYAAWRAVATHDLTPEILGLGGFAATVAAAPEAAGDALVEVVARLGIPEPAMASCFHRALVTLGGWAHAARHRQWQAELTGGSDPTVRDMLTIRLLWDMALLDRYGTRIDAEWRAVLARHAQPLAPTLGQRVDAVLQEAAEHAAQRSIAAALAAALPEPPPASSAELQVAFCIDVRSEVFRRALESVDPGIRTLGFAGFFGLAASHRRSGSDVAEHRLPVLLNPGLTTCAGGPDDAADATARLDVRVTRAWARFKLAAVSSFAFVEAAGPLYGMKLIRDALGLAPDVPAVDPAPRAEPPLDAATKLKTAETVLRAMSLTDDFAPLVILAGHGANVVNNPHASGLHCGACGGYPGDVNARLLASLLNDPEVREALPAAGIVIPDATLFVAGLHDTTTDAVTLYIDDCPSPAHRKDIVRARHWLGAAGALARAERALRLPRADGEASLARRSTDWAETRPEWALAGCRAFIAAPRHRTVGRDLGGRAFLHDYHWHRDPSFAVLELIMTAPVVVASWISLQYYGSVVAPALFGGGNKLLHNVVGGIGVVEGNGGTLRAGLPWQSVHDGHGLAHEPLRLTVCIEAPREAMTDVLERHPGVRALYDNRWLHLFAIDSAGRLAWRYVGQLQWQAIATPAPVAASELAA